MSWADSFGQSSVAGFMNSAAGRVARVLVGVVLIAVGYGLRGGAAGLVIMVVGLVPLLAGVFNLCLISALLGGPISGAQITRRRSKA